MLISEDDNLKEVLTTFWKELSRATVDKRHPFRYVVLTTFSETLESRYVVLRDIDDKHQFYIHTDARSRKVKAIQSHDQVQLLFYDSKKKAQLIVSGRAIVHTEGSMINEAWSGLGEEGRKAYTSKLAPGEVIADKTLGREWLNDSHYFTIIEIDPLNIEVLQLNGSEHIRVSFSAKDDWKGAWLVP